MKHHPAHRKMKKLIESGVIGDIVSCRAQLNCGFRIWKETGDRKRRLRAAVRW